MRLPGSRFERPRTVAGLHAEEAQDRVDGVVELLELEHEFFQHLVGLAHLLPGPPEIGHGNLGDEIRGGHVQVFQRVFLVEALSLRFPGGGVPPVVGSTWTTLNLSSQAKEALFMFRVNNENFFGGEDIARKHLPRQKSPFYQSIFVTFEKTLFSEVRKKVLKKTVKNTFFSGKITDFCH